jgi:hypothetical protein
MSLWTPGGEVPVNRRGEPEPKGQAGPAEARPRPGDRGALSDAVLAEAAAAAGLDIDQLSDDERAQLEAMLLDMAEAQVRLAETPAVEIVINHLGGLYELARIHLSQDPPNFDDASLAIDSLAAVLDAVEERLGPNGPALRDAVQQLQVAFVQLRNRAEPSADPS